MAYWVVYKDKLAVIALCLGGGGKDCVFPPGKQGAQLPPCSASSYLTVFNVYILLIVVFFFKKK